MAASALSIAIIFMCYNITIYDSPRAERAARKAITWHDRVCEREVYFGCISTNLLFISRDAGWDSARRIKARTEHCYLNLTQTIWHFRDKNCCKWAALSRVVRSGQAFVGWIDGGRKLTQKFHIWWRWWNWYYCSDQICASRELIFNADQTPACLIIIGQ